MDDNPVGITPPEAVAHEDAILAAIAKENRFFENDRGLAEYIHDESLNKKQERKPLIVYSGARKPPFRKNRATQGCRLQRTRCSGKQSKARLITSSLSQLAGCQEIRWRF